MVKQSSLPFLILCLFSGAWYSCSTPVEEPASSYDPLDYVDPLIGTGFHGHTFPGATTPFGMVQLSPDTRIPGWDASSGYHYSDSTIFGFSHTHVSGTGIGDMGDILLLPFTGEAEEELIATFDKEEETAEAGYYRVRLDNFDVQAELTATPRSGIHRYTYPAGVDKKLLLDLAHVLQPNWGHQVLSSELEFVDERTIRGGRVSRGWAYDHPVYFYAVFSEPFEVITVKDEGTQRNGASIEGKGLKTWLSFSDAGRREILVKVGISSVDTDGARRNLEAEAPDWDFEALRAANGDAWRAELQKIRIETSDETVLTNFYTAFYHSLIAPMLAQDVDGRYRGMDKRIHQAETDYTNYTVFSMWDTFRAFHPLLTIVDPQRSGDWVRALLRKYEEGGLLPKWPLASNYTGTMVGYPAASVIADAMAKGIGGFDGELALEAAVAGSQYHPEIVARHAEPRAAEVSPKHLDFIARNRYIPADSVNGSVSYGLECAYYDWCIAQIARRMGDAATAEQYEERAGYYRLYFDPATGFMRGKLADGGWRTPFSPYFSDHADSEYIEGNAWQWSWFVPHDVPGLVELHGGREAFLNKLDSLFTTDSTIEGENASADITGLIGQYAHGNEPSHHVAYFYEAAEHPAPMQERLDQILYDFYQPAPDGIIGNEDCGQMSAWYVLNALGFYQPCPGDPTYVIGRPLVDQAAIRLDNGRTFTIRAENNGRTNKYVQSVELNGQALDGLRFTHEDLSEGGELLVRMGPAPVVQ